MSRLISLSTQAWTFSPQGGGRQDSGNKSSSRSTRRHGFAAVWGLLWGLIQGACFIWAQEAPVPPVPPAPRGQYLTLTTPINDRTLARLQHVAQKLITQATQEQREAVLILEIPAGTSALHHVQALCRRITSDAWAPLRTVAWVPQTVTGPHVLLALACREVVIHPDAELGAISREQKLEPDDVQWMVNLGQRRHNPRLPPALIRAMIDPQEVLMRIQVRANPDAPAEWRVVSRGELETLRAAGMLIDSADIIKDAGMVGVFRGETLRRLDILVSQTAENKQQLIALYRLPREALRESTALEERLRVKRIRIEGMITSLMESFVERQIERAQASGADLIIFEIDSPGGELLASVNLANKIAALKQLKIDTVAYIPNLALSGAAIVALGCDEIYMHPEAKLGDAAPIGVRPGGQFERAPEKVLSLLKLELRQLAERKGRPAALAEAMADRSLRVFQVRHKDTNHVNFLTEEEIQAAGGTWIVVQPLRETNGEMLLTIDGRRAHELQLAEPPVHDIDELRERLNIPPDERLAPIEKTWVDELVFLLNHPSMTVLLFILGFSLLYLEMHFPSGLLGSLSALCFAIFFWSRFLGGTAGWLEVVLFVSGVGLLMFEIFVIPGFTLTGMLGIALMVLSIVMASQTFGQLEPYADLQHLSQTLLMFIGASILSAIVVWGMVSQFAKQQAGHTPRGDGSPEDQLLGKVGKAMTHLRPAGKAEFDDVIYDVISDGAYIPPGREVKVIDTSSNRIVVREFLHDL
ncbi:MAG: hypothetical protein KatS3mg114_1083 [Planctomycetaceae bacterium]|nr:MAG: hypothetical protein KatS3mg114_1083 [Planctomycetaceae bacterium]